jgi:predicted SAM-dependent methyltransferase
MPSRQLHIGGTIPAAGWEIFNIVPGEMVDHVGDAQDLSRFDDNTFARIYASHVLEHLDYNEVLERTLKEWRRVLSPGGTLSISVPDLDTLCWLFVHRTMNSVQDRFHLMRMIFGGHMDAHDYHQVGFNEEFLVNFLQVAGFRQISRVAEFDDFEDDSRIKFKGIPISLNMVATK